jgi:hypothetical protein
MAVVVIVTGGVDTGWTFYADAWGEHARHAGGDGGVIWPRRSSPASTSSSRSTGCARPGSRGSPAALRVGACATSLVMILHASRRDHVSADHGRAFAALGIFSEARRRPVLFQHLFWFTAPGGLHHDPAGHGRMSELVAAVSRKQIFGYSFVAFSSLAIAILGFLVWATTCSCPASHVRRPRVRSSRCSWRCPSAVKTFNWAATMQGSVTWESPTYWSSASWACSHRRHGALGDDGSGRPLTDTYFVVAHFHYIVGGAIMASSRSRFWWRRWRPVFRNLGKESTCSSRRSAARSSAVRARLHGHAAPVSRNPEEFQMLVCFRPRRVDPRPGYGLTMCYLIYSLFKSALARRAVGRDWSRVDHPIAADDVRFDGTRSTEPAYHYKPKPTREVTVG